MPVETLHPTYTKLAPIWTRVRDFLAGEHAVKGKGREYLRPLGGQKNDEYEAYKERAEFLNATARTHQGMMGLVFLKDPNVVLPPHLEALAGDADLCGHTLKEYARSVMSEVLAVGRCATLVDWSDEEQRAYFAMYGAEAVRNWRYVRSRGRIKLGMVVLEEASAEMGGDFFEVRDVRRMRVLRLESSGEEGEPEVCRVYVFEEVKTKAGSSWELVSERTLLRGGKPLDFIPLAVHQMSGTLDDPVRPPLDDLVSLNLRHYQLSADHYHGLHFVALPTPWVAGFRPDTELRIGSGVAWVAEDPNARAGFLEFSGAGLGAIRAELDRLESAMVLVGARMLEAPKREAETAEALRLRQAGDAAVLGGLVDAVSESLTYAMKIASWWHVRGEERPEERDDASITLNRDYDVSRMQPAELQALIAAWIQRGISRNTLFWNLKRGELVPPERTYEEEVELIEAERGGEDGLFGLFEAGSQGGARGVNGGGENRGGTAEGDEQGDEGEDEEDEA